MGHSTSFTSSTTGLGYGNGAGSSTHLGSMGGGQSGGSHTRVDHAAERLYDIIYSKCADDNRKHMWPCLIALLAVSRERLREAEVCFGMESEGFGGDGRGRGKKVRDRSSYIYLRWLMMEL
jgi:hypothetical protein